VGSLGRYLRAVAAGLPLIGKVSQAATAAAWLVALVVGGGVVLGVAISPGAGLVIVLAALLGLSVVGGVRLQRRLDAFEGNAPDVEIGDAWHKRELIVSAATIKPRGEWAEFVGFYVVNRGAAAAEHVWAHLTFSLPGGEPFLGIPARPSHAPRAKVGEPFDAPQFTELTLPANGRPEPFDVALRFEEDDRTYALNTRAMVSGGRHDPFEMEGPSFIVTAHVRGARGIDLRRSWRCDSPDFRLVPVEPSDS